MTDNTACSAQRVVETLSAYGNEYVFGIPGGKIDAVFDALHDSGPRLVICRHEQNAALMAAAVGRQAHRYTGGGIGDIGSRHHQPGHRAAHRDHRAGPDGGHLWCGGTR